MSRFGELWAEARREVDETFAQAIAVRPMRPGGQYGRGQGADPDRPTFTVVGLVKSVDADQSVAGDRRNIDFVGRVTGGDVIASIALSQLAGRTVAVGDRIELVERTQDRLFEVLRVSPDGTAALSFELSRASA